MLLVERFDQSAALLVNNVRALLHLMIVARDEVAVISRRGRPRINIQVEQLQVSSREQFHG